jgi:hypothetical protein
MRSFDVSPTRRRQEPTFYGFIPDSASSRTLIFMCMIANGALLLLLRGVSMALLVMTGWRYVATYFVADMGVFFAYKILRNDFWHWAPLTGMASVVVSVLLRLTFKVIADYTGVLFFRIALELGGCYWTFNMVGWARERRARLTPTPITNNSNLCSPSHARRSCR